MYSLIHVLSILLLTGSVFYIVANPQPHKKRKMMILTGVLSLIAFIAAFGLMAKLYNNDFSQGWVIVKLVAWLLLTGLAGMAYRISKSAAILGTVVLVTLAVYMVYFKPF